MANNNLHKASEAPSLCGVSEFMFVELAARAAHEVNRAYCAVVLGDKSQAPWEDAPAWQRESAMTGVRFHLSHPDSKPEDSHNSWLEHKRAEGWTYGPVKDPSKKEHPCMVSYAELSAAQQVKDALFISTIRSLQRVADIVTNVAGVAE